MVPLILRKVLNKASIVRGVLRWTYTFKAAVLDMVIIYFGKLYNKRIVIDIFHGRFGMCDEPNVLQGGAE